MQAFYRAKLLIPQGDRFIYHDYILCVYVSKEIDTHTGSLAWGGGLNLQDPSRAPTWAALFTQTWIYPNLDANGPNSKNYLFVEINLLRRSRKDSTARC